MTDRPENERFASELFEVHLRFGALDGQAFPVLEVEPGVRSPVASRRDLFDPQVPGRPVTSPGDRVVATNFSGAKTDARLVELWLADKSPETRRAYIQDLERFFDVSDGKSLSSVTLTLCSLPHPGFPSAPSETPRPAV